MRHASAPWACTFKRPDLRDLAGVGEIATLDKAERVILKDTVDFDALKNFMAGQ